MNENHESQPLTSALSHLEIAEKIEHSLHLLVQEPEKFPLLAEDLLGLADLFHQLATDLAGWKARASAVHTLCVIASSQRLILRDNSPRNKKHKEAHHMLEALIHVAKGLGISLESGDEMMGRPFDSVRQKIASTVDASPDQPPGTVVDWSQYGARVGDEWVEPVAVIVTKVAEKREEKES